MRLKGVFFILSWSREDQKGNSNVKWLRYELNVEENELFPF